MKKLQFLILFPNKTGGVAEVCKTLHESILLSNHNSIIINSYYNFFLYWIRAIRSNRKIVCITNLQMGFWGIFFKNSIFIIHGYPQRVHEGLLRYKLVVFFHKLFAKFNTHTIAVSRLTKFVCENFYNIPITKVIHNALPYSSFTFIAQNANVAKDENSICYIGRVIKEKGVELICNGVEKLRKVEGSKVIFNVMGGGELFNYIKEKYNHPDNHFFGYVDDKTKVEILAKSKVFISLHPAEPYGVTSLEAAAMNCVCCLSTIGGHIEFVKQEQLFLIKDVEDVNEIVTSLKLSLTMAKSFSFKDSNPYINDIAYYYKKYANSFLELFHESK